MARGPRRGAADGSGELRRAMGTELCLPNLPVTFLSCCSAAPRRCSAAAAERDAVRRADHHVQVRSLRLGHCAGHAALDGGAAPCGSCNSGACRCQGMGSWRKPNPRVLGLPVPISSPHPLFLDHCSLKTDVQHPYLYSSPPVSLHCTWQRLHKNWRSQQRTLFHAFGFFRLCVVAPACQ